MDIVAFENIAIWLYGLHYPLYLEPDCARLIPDIDTMFNLFENGKHYKHQYCRHHCNKIEPTAHGHAYGRDYPDAGGRRQTADRPFHLDYSSRTEKTDTRQNLSGYSARVTSKKPHCLLTHINRKHHRDAGTHRNQRERAQSGHLPFALAFYTYHTAEKQTECYTKNCRCRVELDIVDYVPELFHCCSGDF